MNFKEKFLELTQFTIPYGYEKELEPILPNGWKKDQFGNYFYEIGNSETLFTTHLDTYSDKKEKINHVVEGDIIKTDGTTILGGDNKAGCVILINMIEKNIPGTYYFFLGEESAVHGDYPFGSINAIESGDFSRFKRCISFDRKESGQLITRQLGQDCCSDDFSDSLIKEFEKNGVKYDISISVSDGKIKCNEDILNSFEDFQKWIGQESLNVEDFSKLLISVLTKHGNKLTDAQINNLITLKSNKLEDVIVYMETIGYQLIQIGKGWELKKIEKNRYIKEFSSFRKMS